MPRRTAPGAHGCIAASGGNSHEMAIPHARPRPRREREPQPGHELSLSKGLNVSEAAAYETPGAVVVLKEQRDPERAPITLRADDGRVGISVEPRRAVRMTPGGHLLLDAESGYPPARRPKSE